ncbi:MAG: FecR domain-containing protein [Asticcacaulis sp.]
MTETAEHILDEATDWLIRLSAKPVDAHIEAQFAQWLDADPANAEVWRELNHSYDLIGQTEPELMSQWHKPLAPTGGARRTTGQSAARPGRNIGQMKRPHFTRRAALMAVAASVAIVVAGIAPDLWLGLQSDYRTGKAEIETVALSDGTSVQLGPESAIAVDYTAGERHVRLVKGRALFEVTPDKDRPFQVKAEGLTTTVLGTGFEVYTAGGQTGVGVQHGRVRVETTDAPKTPYILEAGDQVVRDTHNQLKTSQTSPLLIASWTLGEVNARDRTVAEVIHDIRPWYRGRIIITDKTLAAKSINGVYHPRDTAQTLRSMVTPLGGKVTQVTPWIIIVGK